MDTDTRRKPAGSDFTSPVSPLSPRNPVRLSGVSSRFWPAVGCGLPAESNQPTPPPRILIHNGRVAVSSEPTLVPMTKVW